MFIVLLYLTIVINIGVSLIVPVMPVLMRDFGFSYGSISIIFFSIVFSRFIFQNVGGKMISKIGHAKLLIICFSLHMLTMGVYPFISSVSAFIIMRFMEGAFEGMANILLNDLAIILSTKEDRGKKMGYFNSAFGFGFIIGPALGAVMFKYFGLRGMFWSAGVMSLIGLLGLFSIYQSLEGLPKSIQQRGFITNFNKNYLRYFALFSPNFLRRVLLFALQMILPLFLLDRFLIDSDKTGYIFSLSGIVSTVLMPFVGALYVGEKGLDRSYKSVVINLFIMALVLTSFGFVNNFKIFLILFTIETIAFSFMLPAATKVFGDAIEEDPFRGQILGFFSSLRELAVLIIPFILMTLYKKDSIFAWIFVGSLCLISSFPYLKYLLTKQDMAEELISEDKF